MVMIIMIIMTLMMMMVIINSWIVGGLVERYICDTCSNDGDHHNHDDDHHHNHQDHLDHNYQSDHFVCRDGEIDVIDDGERISTPVIWQLC